jgi:hypothetical protein
MISRTLSRQGWTAAHFLAAFAMLALALTATSAISIDIYHTTLRNHDPRSLVLVPLVIIHLFWVRRERLRLCIPQGGWVGPILVLAGWACALLGPAQNLEILFHLAALLIILGCVLSVLGTSTLTHFLPAFLALALFLPIPATIENHLWRPLQTAASDLLIPFLPAPAPSTIPPDPLPAVTCDLACMLVLSYGFAFAIPLRPAVRFLILASSPLAALAAYLLRMILLTWTTPRLTPHQHAIIDALAGWVIIPLFFLLFAALVRLLTWASLPVRPYALAKDY